MTPYFTTADLYRFGAALFLTLAGAGFVVCLLIWAGYAIRDWADRTVKAHIDAADQYPEPERFDRWHEDLGSDWWTTNYERRTQ